MRVSHFGCRSIIASRVGLHAADPTKQITKSNTSYIWYTRWATLVLFPQRLDPTAPRTQGILSRIRLGSQTVTRFLVADIIL